MESGIEMHLALGFDQNYLIAFYAFTASVLKSNPQHRIYFHALVTGLTEEDKQTAIDYVARHGGQISFYAVPSDFAAEFNSHGFGRATFYRLLCPELLPTDIKRFIYIDVDTLVLGDLAALYKTDMGSYPVAAIAEPKIVFRPELGMVEEGLYFNAGVLLINRDEWVRQCISEKALSFLHNNHKTAYYADQDSLNATLIGNWLQLPIKFNLMRDCIPRDLRKSQIKDYLKDKVVIHFTQFYKPWHTLCNNKLRHLFFYYLQFTPMASVTKPVDVKMSPSIFWKLVKIKGRELYYDYPVIPLSVVDRLMKLLK